MHVCSFVPVTGASFRKRSGQSLDTGRRATAPSRARCRQRSHVLAVAQVSGESKVTPAPEACSEQPEDDGPKRFTVITKVYETPGGWLVDAAATNFGKQTKHTVILGKKIMNELCEGLETEERPSPADIVEYLFDYFMEKGQPLTNTEGLLDVGIFPINYFAVRQVFYFFSDAKEVLISRIKEGLSDS